MKQSGQLKGRRGLKALIVIVFTILHGPVYVHGQAPADNIVGKWMSSQRNVIVEIFKETNTYQGRVVWFDDSDNKSSPMNERIDQNNPNPALRKQKVIGLIVLRYLTYDAMENRWENGKIYDVQSGKKWDSSVWITKDGLLKVKGYWHFEIFGKTMTFKRV